MKHFLKGIATVLIVTLVSMAVHVFCNMHDIHLDSAATGIVTAICAVAFYHALIMNERKDK